MGINVRAVEIQDARAIHRICIQDDVLPYMVFLPSMRVEAMENRIRNLAPNQFEFVAEYDGEVVGFVGLTQSPGRRSHSGDLFIGWQDFQISGEALYGDILAFIAAGIITAYFFISQHVRKDLSLIPYSVISYGSSAGFLGCNKNNTKPIKITVIPFP